MESFFTKSWLRVLSGLFTNLAAGSFALVVITPNFIGIDNFIIVDTGDALLICDKDQTGQVGEALKEVKSRKISIT